MRSVLAIAMAAFWLTMGQMSFAQSAKARLLEQEEQVNETLREHCRGLHYRRSNASASGAWRELINTSKSYVDACAQVDDRFQISKAFEDMSMALLNLNDPVQALRWAQSCLDSNSMAVGCAARKADILWQQGRYWEARSAIARGIMTGERAVGLTKVEIERTRMNKPDPRAETVFRARYLRKLEQMEGRLSTLEDGLRLIKDMQDGMDAASGDNSSR